MSSKFKVFNSDMTLEHEDMLVEDTETSVDYQMYTKGKVAILLEMDKPVNYEYVNETLISKLNDAVDKNVMLNRTYSLWKDGRKYKSLFIALNANSMDIYVVYKALYGNFKCYARPYQSFVSKVDKGRQADNKTNQNHKFELID